MTSHIIRRSNVDCEQEHIGTHIDTLFERYELLGTVSGIKLSAREVRTKHDGKEDEYRIEIVPKGGFRINDVILKEDHIGDLIAETASGEAEGVIGITRYRIRFYR